MHNFYVKANFILQGAYLSITYTAICVSLGSILAVLIAIVEIRKPPIINSLLRAFSSLIRGTPILVQLYLTYYFLPSLIGLSMPTSLCIIIAFTLNSACYLAKTIKAGIESVDSGQIDAAKMLKIPVFYQYKDIILPQAIRTILPSLLNESVALLKETAVISMLGECDIMRNVQIVSMQDYDFITPLLIAAGYYYCLSMLIGYIAKRIEVSLNMNKMSANKFGLENP